MIEGLDDLEAIGVDLLAAAATIDGRLVDVTDDSGRRLRDDARSAAPRGPNTASYPDAITHTVETAASAVAVEVGPERGLPDGEKGNLIEYGSVNNDPIPHVGPAFDRERDRFIAAVADEAGGVL